MGGVCGRWAEHADGVCWRRMGPVDSGWSWFLPQLLKEFNVRAAANELDEVLVGRGVGVGLPVSLAQLLALFQLSQQGAVDVVRVTKLLHQGAQYCGYTNGE